MLVVDAAQGIEAQTLANCYLALEHDLEIVAALNKIDLPAADPDRYADEIETGARHRRRRHPAHHRQDRRGRRRAARRRHRAHPGAHRRPRRAAAGAHLRLASTTSTAASCQLDPGDERPHRARTSGCASCRPAPSTRPTRSACALPVPDAGRRARPGRGRLPHRRHQGRRRGPLGRDGHRRPAGRRATALDGLPRPQADGVLRPVPGRRRRLRGPAREPREAAAQRRRRSPTSPRRRARSASASAAASSACCTWRSCGSASSASSTWPSSPPRPSVEYRVHAHRRHASRSIDNPADMPPPQEIDHIEEPYLQGHRSSRPTTTPARSWSCASSRRGEMQKLEYLSPERVELIYRIPLAEVVIDFFDQLKSRTQGYASLDYEPAGYEHGQPGARSTSCSTASPADAFSHDRAPRPGLRVRAAHVREAEGADPAPAVRRADPGRHRRARSSPARR